MVFSVMSSIYQLGLISWETSMFTVHTHSLTLKCIPEMTFPSMRVLLVQTELLLSVDTDLAVLFKNLPTRNDGLVLAIKNCNRDSKS